MQVSIHKHNYNYFCKCNCLCFAYSYFFCRFKLLTVTMLTMGQATCYQSWVPLMCLTMVRPHVLNVFFGTVAVYMCFCVLCHHYTIYEIFIALLNFFS
jgi:hypothetical protein